jgi:hypothetical protein
MASVGHTAIHWFSRPMQPRQSPLGNHDTWSKESIHAFGLVVYVENNICISHFTLYLCLGRDIAIGRVCARITLLRPKGQHEMFTCLPGSASLSLSLSLG